MPQHYDSFACERVKRCRCRFSRRSDHTRQLALGDRDRRLIVGKPELGECPHLVQDALAHLSGTELDELALHLFTAAQNDLD